MPGKSRKYAREIQKNAPENFKNMCQRHSEKCARDVQKNVSPSRAMCHRQITA
jgi:hypothetical protein